ncbi:MULTISPECIES: hypothetical protein [Clostridium]|uniref:Uncharacterized protein n=1 Tax=Clostridium intestinale TaxID=36845 RepID=A0A7D7A0Y0_9CLOT|nr:hypothetical protein HZF06_13130 [Clostridium intestinale]
MLLVALFILLVTFTASWPTFLNFSFIPLN